MPEDPDEESALRWADVALAAAVFASDPAGTGGVALKGGTAHVRDLWLGRLRKSLPAAMPFRRFPSHITDDRLLGGLDLAATLKAGRPVAERGLLADVDGGVLVVPMAERLSAATAGRLANALDLKEVVLERDGLARRLPARFGIVALDESMSDDERMPAALLDRLAMILPLDGLRAGELPETYTTEDIDRARRLPATISDDAIAALCAAAVAFGVGSLNAPLLAVRVARLAAALHGRDAVAEEDAAAAARLVIAPRATMMPAETHEDEKPAEPPSQKEESDDPAEQTGPLEDVVVAAAKAAIPPDLLALLQPGRARQSRNSSSGRSGASKKSPARGPTVGVRTGSPSGGARLNVVETLRAAAPWQPLRRQAKPAAAGRIEIRPCDFRIKRLKSRTETATIFLVDASGSTALQRLGEAKGAVELLLADCYIRRDEVALIAFSGRGAELLLPPTRSLARARRNLADLPGGGGTPIAAGIEAAATLADSVRRKGQTPGIVMLTDGRANVSRNGQPGRGAAEDDALLAAKHLRATGVSALLIDTSTQPQPQAARIASAMGAEYIPLPHADAETLSQAVRRRAGGRLP